MCSGRQVICAVHIVVANALEPLPLVGLAILTGLAAAVLGAMSLTHD